MSEVRKLHSDMGMQPLTWYSFTFRERQTPPESDWWGTYRIIGPLQEAHAHSPNVTTDFVEIDNSKDFLVLEDIYRRRWVIRLADYSRIIFQEATAPDWDKPENEKYQG